MISTTPTVAEIDATINLLNILELAKDATKLKASLAKIKEAQDAAKAASTSAESKLRDIAATQRSLEILDGQVQAQRDKLRIENQAHIRNCEILDNERAAMRTERDKFDQWMAMERENMADLRARINSDLAANERRAGELAQEVEQLEKKNANVASAQRAAEALRLEYEQKIASLKQMVG